MVGRMKPSVFEGRNDTPGTPPPRGGTPGWGVPELALFDQASSCASSGERA